MAVQPEATRDKGKGKETSKGESSDSLPWVEKYRPKTLEDVVSQSGIVQTIGKFIEGNRLPHLLFYGPPGTGKTSTILAVARQIYGGKPGSLRNNVLELNASDERGIDVVREQIVSFSSTRMVFSSGFKLVILDEADMMTTAAQSALRRVIETYTRNVRFCIICNYVNKIIPAIQSRCTRFRFGPLEEKDTGKRLDNVVELEKVNITDEGKQALLKLAKGDMRRVLNVLQACHSAYDKIDEEAVYTCTGSPHPKDIETIVESMMTEDFEVSLRRIHAIKSDKGLALQDIISGIYDLLLTLSVTTAARVYLLDQLAAAEYRLSTGASEQLQLSALLGAFKNTVELTHKGR